MKKDIICTICPKGCTITVEGDKIGIVSVLGHGCKRGEAYATAEFTSPVRILTTTVKIEGMKNELLPVRSNNPIPKELILDCMELIKKASVKPPVKQYDVVIPNVCGSGADIVATKEVL